MLISILLRARNQVRLQQRTTAKADKSFNCGTKFSIMIRRRPDHDLISLFEHCLLKA